MSQCSRRTLRGTRSCPHQGSAAHRGSRYHAGTQEHKEQQVRRYVQWARESWSKFGHRQREDERDRPDRRGIQDSGRWDNRLLNGCFQEGEYRLCWRVGRQALEILRKGQHLCFQGQFLGKEEVMSISC